MPSRTVMLSLIVVALAAGACSSDGTIAVDAATADSVATESGADAGDADTGDADAGDADRDAGQAESEEEPEQSPPEAVPLGEQVGAIEVIGDYLEPMPQRIPVTEPENDSAIGQKAPEIIGTSFDGSTVSITADGTPRMIMFVAHWCPHCQREVPAVKAMIDDGLLPPDVEVVVVSTAVREGEDKFPPQEWLQGEQWAGPILRDSAGFDALLAYGAGGFPFAVYVNRDNEVVTRTAGEIPGDIIQQLWLVTAAE